MADAQANLIELAAAHRAEMEVLRDPSALFALGFLEHAQSATRAQLAGDLGLEANALNLVLDKLNHAGLLNSQNQVLIVSLAGKALLHELGLSIPLAPPPNSNPESASQISTTASSTGASGSGILGIAGVLIVGTILVAGAFIFTPLGDMFRNTPDDKTPVVVTQASPTPVTQRDTATRQAQPASTTDTPRVTAVSSTATFAPPVSSVSLAVAPRAMLFHPNGKLVYVGLATSVDQPGTITVHDAQNGTRVSSIELPIGFRPSTLVLAPDSQRLYAIGAGVAAIDLRTRQVIQRSLPHHGLNGGALFSRDGKWLFVSAAKTIEILDAETLEFVESLQVGGGSVFQALRWSRDGNFLYAPRVDNLLAIYQIEFARTPAAKLVSRVSVPGGPIDAIPSPDDSRLYVPLFYENTIAVVNIQDRSVETKLPIPYHVSQMDVNPSGTVAAGASAGYAYLLDTKSGQLQQHKIAATDYLTAISPDGSLVWTAVPTQPKIHILRVTR
jgi:DNA-binding beta-propeller fold protein YncE